MRILFVLALLLSGHNLDFGTQKVGTDSAPIIVRYWNTSKGPDGTGEPVTISSTRLEVGTQFMLANDSCAGQTIEPGKQCSLEVRFEPRQAGEANDTLLFTDSEKGQQLVRLHGVGQ